MHELKSLNHELELSELVTGQSLLVPQVRCLGCILSHGKTNLIAVSHGRIPPWFKDRAPEDAPSVPDIVAALVHHILTRLHSIMLLNISSKQSVNDLKLLADERILPVRSYYSAAANLDLCWAE